MNMRNVIIVNKYTNEKQWLRLLAVCSVEERAKLVK